jgi:hypothetical protein
LLTLIALSCKKQEDTTGNVIPSNFKTYSSMDDIFTSLSLQPKVMTMLADSGGSFYGSSGTRYIFLPGSFQDAGGVAVTGNVQVSVTEYLKKGDMIFSGILPVSDGVPIISGGEISVKVTKGGSEIFLKPGMYYQAKIPQFGSKDTVMTYFTGTAGANTNSNKVNWALVNDSTKHGIGYVVYNGDTITIFSDSLKFANADRFMTNPDYQKFSVTVVATGATASAASLLTYALYDSYKGVWPLTASSGNVYSEHHVPNIPVHFVSMGLINNHFYGGVLAATPKTGGNYQVTLTEVKPEDFKAQINALY